MLRNIAAALIGAALCLALSGQVKAEDEAKKPVPDYILKAYASDIKDTATLEAYAAAADTEGYKGAATLFRAFSKSKAIHAEKRAALIKQLGGEVAAPAKKSEIKAKTTKENLEAASKSFEEAKTLFSDLAKQADEAEDPAAMQLKGALAIANENMNLCQDALAALDKFKEPTQFQVCTVCGYVVQGNDFEKCPLCSAPKDKFESIK